MSLKTSLTSAALAMAAAVPGAALADHPSFGVSVDLPDVSVHAHTADCHHDDLPPAPPNGVPLPSGRYELQTVQTWVPGRYEQVVIQGQCFTKHRRHHSRTWCSPDRVENRWVEGYYQQTQQWVWVDDGYQSPNPRYSDGPRYRYGRRHHASRVR